MSKIFTLNEIPGGVKIKEVLERCIKSTQHLETLAKYKKALSILESNKITCLKVSDFNTVGMNGDAWDILLNNVGSSYKINNSSAGRHGIGKKASFLMSLCNTVFYSSKHINEEIRFGGKPILTDWVDNDNWKSSKGWFGKIEFKNSGPEVKPIMNSDIEYFSKTNDFFIRKGEYGTDIIIIALIEKENFYDDIIKSVLENFYVGIKESKLEVCVDNIDINKNTIGNIIQKYYNSKFSKSNSGSDNIVAGLLKDYDLAYCIGNKKTVQIYEPNGFIDIFLTTENKENKKYYAFYRDHGMKIKDINVQTDKPFSAVVITRGDELNSFLSKRENAAHDDFVIDVNDPNYKDINKTLRNIYSKIEDVICEFTKLEVSQKFLLEELIDMIDICGDMSKYKKNQQKNKNHNPELKAIVQKNTKDKYGYEWTDKYSPFDVPEPDGNRKNINPNYKKRPLPVKKVDPDGLNNNDDNLICEVIYEKFFAFVNQYYIVKFNITVPIKNVRLYLYAKNVDGSFNDVTHMMSEIYIVNINYSIKENVVIIDRINALEDVILKIKLKNSSRYKLFARIQGVQDETTV